MVTLIQVVTQTGNKVYIFIFNASGQVWNTNTLAFETYNSSNWSNYVILCTEYTGSGNYFVTIPTQIQTTAGNYTWTGYVELTAPTPTIGDTVCSQGNFQELLTITTGLASLILNLRGIVDDAPDSKIVYGEMLGSGDTPMFPVNGVNQLFRLKKPILSDVAGAPTYTWVTVVGNNPQVRTQIGFTVADPVNGIISFSQAPDPGNGSYPTIPPVGVYVDYNWQYYSDVKYAQWINQATQMTLAGTTDPTTLVSGLSDAMLQFAAYLVYQALSTRYAPQFSSSGGEAHTDAQTPAQAFRSLAAQAYKNAMSLQTLYYQRQGQRNAPSWADINHNWDPISPQR